MLASLRTQLHLFRISPFEGDSIPCQHQRAMPAVQMGLQAAFRHMTLFRYQAYRHIGSGIQPDGILVLVKCGLPLFRMRTFPFRKDSLGNPFCPLHRRNNRTPVPIREKPVSNQYSDRTSYTSITALFLALYTNIQFTSENPPLFKRRTTIVNLLIFACKGRDYIKKNIYKSCSKIYKNSSL